MFATTLSDEFDFNITLEEENSPTVDARFSQCSPPDTQIHLQNIRSYSTSGIKPYNEDHIDFIQTDNFTLAALFDGHGDQTVSLYLKEHLLKTIVSHSAFFTDPIEVISKCLADFESYIISGDEFESAGSTVLLVLMQKQKIVVFNIGDCMALGFERSTQKYFQLNSLHNLENQSERNEIMKKKGLILRTGGCYRLNGLISLSRSIGDRTYKKYLSATPQVRVYENVFTKIVLVTDGFYSGRQTKTIEEIEEDLRTGKCFRDNATFLQINNSF